MNSSTGKETEATGKQSGFQQDLEHIRQIPLFQNLEYESLKLIAMLSRQINLIDGDQIITQGEDDGNSYYVISGQLKCFHRRDNVDYPIQNFAGGQFFGGLSLFGKSIRLYSVIATEESSVLRLSREGFQKIMRQYPESLNRITANLVADVTAWEQKLLTSTGDRELVQAAEKLGISII